MRNLAVAERGPGSPPLIDHFDSGLQFLAFELASEYYAVDILRVVEIRGWTPVTAIPNTPSFVKGVLNLRGTIVPILDLRDRFHLESRSYTPTTVVIVVSIQTESGDKVVGMVVDAVSCVMDILESEMKPAPDFGTSIHTEFIRGLATVNERMVMLLDLDCMLTNSETKQLDYASKEAKE